MHFFIIVFIFPMFQNYTTLSYNLHAKFEIDKTIQALCLEQSAHAQMNKH